MLSPQALELVQDSKATIFLVLELARGGELFDRIKVRLQVEELDRKSALSHSGVRHVPLPIERGMSRAPILSLLLLLLLLLLV